MAPRYSRFFRTANILGDLFLLNFAFYLVNSIWYNDLTISFIPHYLKQFVYINLFWGVASSINSTYDMFRVMRIEKGHVAGMELDGRTTPDDLGLSWAIGKTKKDFVGKRSLVRPDMVVSGRKQLVGLLTETSETVLEEGAQLDEQGDLRRRLLGLELADHHQQLPVNLQKPQRQIRLGVGVQAAIGQIDKLLAMLLDNAPAGVAQAGGQAVDREVDPALHALDLLAVFAALTAALIYGCDRLRRTP